MRGDRLRAISVWQCEPSLLTDHDTGFDVHDKDRAAEVQTAAQAELDIVLAGATVPATELLVCEGDAAQVLIEESREADMLIVRRIPWPRRPCGCPPGLGQPRLCVARTMPGHGRPLILGREDSSGP